MVALHAPLSRHRRGSDSWVRPLCNLGAVRKRSRKQHTCDLPRASHAPVLSLCPPWLRDGRGTDGCTGESTESHSEAGRPTRPLAQLRSAPH